MVSYVFREPTYLETPRGLELLREDEERLTQRIAAFGRPVLNHPEVTGEETSAPSQAEDIVARLTQLKSLFDAGLISSEEYEAKRRELLSHL